MAEDDFDIASLAAYLHMMPAQVSRLVERGKLPGRRVGSHWKFSRPEISQWLEQRIGVSDDEELAAMETTLEQADLPGAAAINLAEWLSPECIAVPLLARTKGSVISAMCQLAASSGLLWDPDKLADAVAARESMASTALESGVAMLHPRRPQPSILAQGVMALGITSQGIPYGGVGGGLTDIFILIAATADHEYLRILARVSRIMSDSDLLFQLRSAEDARTARHILLERDAELGNQDPRAGIID